MAVYGLYGHIRRNNFRSLAMIASFLLIFQIVQVMYFKWFPMMLIMREQWRTGIDQHITNPSMNELVGPLFGGFTGSKHMSHLSEIMPKVDPNYVPVGDPPGGIDALVAMFKYANIFDGIWLVMTLFAVVYLAVTIGWSSFLVRRVTKAKPLQRDEFPDLYNLVENLAITAGIPCPKIELIDTPKLNAYATGLGPAAGRIGLTHGLLTSLTRDELEAVIAHELTHIKNRDTRLMIIARACFGFLLPSVGKWARALAENPLIEMTRAFVIAAALTWFLGATMMLPFALTGLFVFLLTMTLNKMISQSREYIADAGALELTKNPMALTSALQKISMADDLALSGTTVKAMMISGASDGWFATHPRVADRIKAFVSYGGLNEGERQIVSDKLRPAKNDAIEAASGRSQTASVQLGQHGIGAHGPLFGLHAARAATGPTVNKLFEQPSQTSKGNGIEGLPNRIVGTSKAFGRGFLLYVMLPIWGFGIVMGIVSALM